MGTKQAAWNEMSKVKFQLDNKLGELESAKDNYKNELVKETKDHMMNILKEEGTLSERDFDLFLGNLARDIKHLYNN